MATNKDRGTKRTCQNGECGARFYDLNRSPIVCPICGSKYAIAHSPSAAAAVAQEERAQRKMVKKPEFEPAAVLQVSAEEKGLLFAAPGTISQDTPPRATPT